MVFRMIMGGSAGLMTMMLFDSLAPPISRTLLAVVRVNSSIFCLVPGPALRLEMVDTVSAYWTGQTLLDGSHDGYRRLRPAGDQIDIGFRRMFLEVHHRDNSRPHRGRGQIDRDNIRCLEARCMREVRSR